MEDKNKQAASAHAEARVGSGSLLAAAREKQKKSVEEIAEELNLSVTQIKTIESDQSEGLPEPTYVRGYIRSYAKLLGLDVDKVLESYLHPNWQKSSSLDDMPRGIGNAEEESRRFFTPAKVVVLLMFLAVLAFLWYSGMLSSFINKEGSADVVNDLTTQDNTQHVETLQSEVLSEESQTSIVAENVATPSTEDQNQVIDQTATTEATDSQVQADEQETAELIVNNDLVLFFSKTCWVDIRDANDKRLAYKNYSSGETLTVTNDERLHVFLGNAEGVTATYQNKEFDISKHREGVYAKFSLIKE